MSSTIDNIEFLHLYGLWFHKEMVKHESGDRENKPTIQDFVGEEVIKENWEELKNLSIVAKCMSKCINDDKP